MSTKDKDVKQDIKQDDQEQHIGLTTMVRLRGFNDEREIPGKIDTGAETSSLHASNLKVHTEDHLGSSTVSFSFGSNKYTMPVSGFQSVSSADGGVTNRPMVSFTVYIADKVIPNVMFNLNDRSNMEYEMLIGLNLIKQAKLKVDPSISEMEINFGVPNAGQTSEISPPSIDNTVASNDNDSSNDDAFIKWYQSNKGKTLEEVFSQLINGSNKIDQN